MGVQSDTRSSSPQALNPSGVVLNSPIVGMAATADGRGYWLVASDGGVFTFGDLGFHGCLAADPLNSPIVGMAATPEGKGYWLVTSDGTIRSFGDAQYHGSMSSWEVQHPVVGIVADMARAGYWLVTSDGSVFGFGAPFRGSAATIKLP